MGEGKSDFEKAMALVQSTLDKALRAKASKGAGRGQGACEIVAVSKTRPVAVIREALEAGQTIFGENRVQEAAEKWPALRDEFGNIELRLIGPLQSNKVKVALQLFDVIETLDRPKLARALARERDAGVSLPDLYIQVNSGEEPQKAGVHPAGLAALVALARDELDLPVVGLMCIPPMAEDPAIHFALLKKLADRHGLNKLSMGMSADFALAARLGATSVRVGTALFGARS
jgi:PLP dependent protein